MKQKLTAWILVLCLLLTTVFSALASELPEPVFEPVTVIQPDPTVNDVPEVVDPFVKASIRSGVRYCFLEAGTGIPIRARVNGTDGPFDVELKIEDDKGEVLYSSAHTLYDGEELELTYTPDRGGDHIFYVRANDTAGKRDSARVVIPVARAVVEYPEAWEKTLKDVELTGDWREDILAVAFSQLGYEESPVNFIYEEGVRRPYTRYGQWYGSSYAEWCGMFVSFCIHYAGISEDDFPYDAHVGKWMDKLEDKGVLYDAHSYTPRRGDLIFLQWETDETPSHMGIVERVDDENVYTIEGNVTGFVRRMRYPLGSSDIIAYGRTAKLMEKNGLEAEDIEPPKAQVEVSGIAVTAHDSVNMRSKTTSSSRFLRRIDEAGTEVELIGLSDVDGERWYLVQYHNIIGCVRGDLLIVPPEVASIPVTTPEENPTESEEDEPVEAVDAEPIADGAMAVTTVGKVNIRKQADIGSPIVVKLQNAGTEVEVLEQAENEEELWYRVRFESNTGYIRGDLLQAVKTTAQPQAEEPEADAPDIQILNEGETACECTDEEGNRICAEDCACECHIVTEPEPEAVCECTDELGNRLCLIDCACECHIVPEPEAVNASVGAYAANGLDVLLQSEYTGNVAWERGVENENGELVWETLAGETGPELIISAEMENLRCVYRSLSVGEDGSIQYSQPAALIEEELRQWVNESGATMEMLHRAMKSTSLESLIIENNKLIYVRTGEAIATFHPDTCELWDDEHNVLIGVVDVETGEVSTGGRLIPNKENDVQDEAVQETAPSDVQED